MWFQDQGSLGAVVDRVVLQMKALEIHQSICQQLGTDCVFKASDGWLQKFRKWKNVCFKKTIGEATVNQELVKSFVEMFEKKSLKKNGTWTRFSTPIRWFFLEQAATSKTKFLLLFQSYFGPAVMNFLRISGHQERALVG